MEAFDATLQHMYRRHGAMVITLRAAAAEIGRDYETARRLAVEGRFPARRRGARWEVPLPDLALFITSPEEDQGLVQLKPSSDRWRRTTDAHEVA